VETWRVLWLPEAQRELGRLPQQEQVAMMNATRKLEVVGPALGHPHTSDVRGADPSASYALGRGAVRGEACTGGWVRMPW
jgi:hypothetical protein